MMTREEARRKEEGAMATTKLRVQVMRLEGRQGQSGTYVIAHLTGGRRAYVWDPKLARSLAPGCYYEAEVEERRGILRLISAKPITPTNGTQGHVQAQEERPQEASTAPGHAQERLEALRLAVVLAPHFGCTDISQVLVVAERLLRWLRRGEG
jgi:hypothetical protein